MKLNSEIKDQDLIVSPDSGKQAVVGSTVILGDCVEVMKGFEDNQFDLAIVDPPYGIGAGKRIGTTYKEGVLKNKKGFGNNKLYTAKSWDNEVPTAEYWEQLFRVSKNQIVWGGNYFTSFLPESRGWIYWDKKIINFQIDNYSDGELAWTSFDCVLRKVTYDWIGLGYCNSTEKGTRIHPTHKPVFLYEWILQKYSEAGMKILDTHLGSGSSRIAADKAGLDFTGIEIDKEYFDLSEKRFKQYKSQLRIEGW